MCAAARVQGGNRPPGGRNPNAGAGACGNWTILPPRPRRPAQSRSRPLHRCSRAHLPSRAAAPGFFLGSFTLVVAIALAGPLSPKVTVLDTPVFLEDARTIFELCVGTGQRIADCVAMEWSDFDGEFMSVVQDKTKARMTVYCPARLHEYLGTLPRRGRHIMAKNLTQPMGKRAAQKGVEALRTALGIMHGEARLVPHGWRYTAAVQLCDAGCSDAEIQAVTGHTTTEMVQKYRARRDQKKASKRAQQKRGY